MDFQPFFSLALIHETMKQFYLTRYGDDKVLYEAATPKMIKMAALDFLADGEDRVSIHNRHNGKVITLPEAVKDKTVSRNPYVTVNGRKNRLRYNHRYSSRNSLLSPLAHPMKTICLSFIWILNKEDNSEKDCFDFTYFSNAVRMYPNNIC